MLLQCHPRNDDEVLRRGVTLVLNLSSRRRASIVCALRKFLTVGLKEKMERMEKLILDEVKDFMQIIMLVSEYSSPSRQPYRTHFIESVSVLRVLIAF